MFAYYIDPIRRLAITRASGRLTAVSLADYLPKLFRDPKFDPSYDALIVAMDTDTIPSPATAAILAPIVRSWSARRSGVRWAFVLPNEDARRAAELALNQVRLTTITARCFVSEAAALAWLESANTAAARHATVTI